MTKEERKIYNAKYAQSAKGKAAKRRYKQSAKGKASRKAADRRYKQSAKGKVAIRRYKQSAKGKAAQKRGVRKYSHSAKGKVTIRRYEQSAKRKAYMTPERMSWLGMLQRCTNPNANRWKWYGGAGVRVCKRWLTSFKAFLADMGPRPKGTTLSRFGDIGNYSPSNCAWHTRAQQRVEAAKKTKRNSTHRSIKEHGKWTKD